MALVFHKKEPVTFGDISSVPVVDEESKLRLQDLDIDSSSGIDEAYKVLAGCFPDKKTEVEVFMRQNFTTFNLQVLRAYLIGGQQLVDITLARLDKVVEEEMNK